MESEFGAVTDLEDVTTSAADVEGFPGEEPLTTWEHIGAAIGCSGERAKQIGIRAMGKVAKAMSAGYLR